MGILLWIALGVAAGSLARVVMPGLRAGGIALAMFFGICGALMGGVAGSVLNGGLTMEVDPRSTIMALVATLAVLFCYRSFALRLEPQPMAVELQEWVPCCHDMIVVLAVD